MNRYSFEVAWSDSDRGYVALCPEFPGISAFGEAAAEAVAELLVALELAIETYHAEGWELPGPRIKHEYSGQIRVRLPRGLHEKLANRAADDAVSLNTLIISYLAEAVAGNDVATQIHQKLDNALDEWGALLREAQQQADQPRRARPRQGSSGAPGSVRGRRLNEVFMHAAGTVAARGEAGRVRNPRGRLARGPLPDARARIAHYGSEEWLNASEKATSKSEIPA